MEPAKQYQFSTEKPPQPVVIVLTALDQDRALHAPEFQGLAPMPLSKEWFAQEGTQRRRALEANMLEFIEFVGMKRSVEFRVVAREHFLAWQRYLEAWGYSAPRIQRKLEMLSSLFAYLCAQNALLSNPWPICSSPTPKRIKRSVAAPGDQAEQAARSSIQEGASTSEAEIDRWADGLAASLEALRSQMKRKIREQGG